MADESELDKQRRLIGPPGMRLNTPANLPGVSVPGVPEGIPLPGMPEFPTPPKATPTYAPSPAQTGVDTARSRLEKQQQWQFGSQINNPFARGALRGLDVLGSIMAPHIAQAIPGTTLHHQQELGQAEKELGLAEQGQQVESKTGLEQAEAELARNRPRMEEARLEYQANIENQKEQARQQLQEQAQREAQDRLDQQLQAQSERSDTQQERFEQQQREAEARQLRQFAEQEKLAAIREAHRQEPGNYTPVTNAAGETLGWVDVKSGHYKGVGEIPGVGQALGGVQAIPAKPTMQERNADVQARLSHAKIPEILGEVDTLGKSNEIGPVMGRWDKFMQGKLGAKDPAFAQLRTDLLFLSSAIALMHAQGRLPENLRREFDHQINAPQQSPENLKAILTTADSWLTGRIGVLHPEGQQSQKGVPIPKGAVIK